MLEGNAGLEEVLLAPLRRMTELQVHKRVDWRECIIINVSKQSDRQNLCQNTDMCVCCKLPRL